MELSLSPIEVRILGVLIEKQMSTPDYYPMTLNALVNACNQKTNREPVMNLEEAEVEQAITSLRRQRLIWQVKIQNSRLPKYEHNMQETGGFSSGELALLGELLLRSPQTAGELRTHTARMTTFHTLGAVEYSLQKLITHEKGPFVVQLAMQPGRKEHRYAHLFSPLAPSPPDNEMESLADEPDRLEELEQKVAHLQTEIAELRELFSEFKRQFD